MTALESGRRMAESRMTDECVVVRAGEEVWDEEQGTYLPGTVQIYSGRCRIRHGSGSPVDDQPGGMRVAVGKIEIHVPVGTTPFAPSDVVAVTASSTRPDQVGREFTVQGPFDGSQTTALRYVVEVADA